MTIVKVGFMISGQAGTGLVIAKLPNGSWSAPSAIGCVGLSGGFEVGGELIEIMIILYVNVSMRMRMMQIVFDMSRVVDMDSRGYLSIYIYIERDIDR